MKIAALAEYLVQGNTLPSFESIESVEQFSSGQSNPTYLLNCKFHPSGENADVVQKIVLRKKPGGQLLQSAHQIEREYQVIKALAQSDVEVPELLHLCLDESIIGTPFYLMRYISGRIFKDPALPDISAVDKGQIYAAAADMLARIHNVDVDVVGLSDYGRRDGFVTRQMARWTKQYQASTTTPIDEMDKLIAWLNANIPAGDVHSESGSPGAQSTLIHGDYRLDNMIFALDKNEILAVLDWELSTLGNPLSDLGYFSIIYHLAPNTPAIAGLAGLALEDLGIPNADEFAAEYLRCRAQAEKLHVGFKDEQKFFVVFALFRLAAIAQGVAARARQGIASSADAERVGRMTRPCAQLALSLI